ncbi:hypothetical protein PTTG_28833 [Puccinia triticina 1-1 BBBD Race 1]|uniref:Uncharacterized protein n=1 Tax=Puccinia triticina (isolate 1-1 / race 1 (BBBD)) TaxID=630390 RepID=A0A180GAW4_PUCT1|nr:hypothetical protein PTTG_28833 [Puccinia triticina 1-1 BBBD Race 1]
MSDSPSSDQDPPGSNPSSIPLSNNPSDLVLSNPSSVFTKWELPLDFTSFRTFIDHGCTLDRQNYPLYPNGATTFVKEANQIVVNFGHVGFTKTTGVEKRAKGVWKVQRTYCLRALVCDVDTCQWVGSPPTARGGIQEYIDRQVFWFWSQSAREPPDDAQEKSSGFLATRQPHDLIFMSPLAGCFSDIEVYTSIHGPNPKHLTPSLVQISKLRLSRTCQDSGLSPERRKRKERNPNPARGDATSTPDKVPKRPKRSGPLISSKLATDTTSDPTGSSLNKRISDPSTGAASIP